LLAALLIAPLLPALNLLFPVGTVVAERVTYLPSVALCVLLAGLLLSHGPRHGLPLVVAIVAMFSARTLSYTRVWRDDETLSREALAAQPSSAKVQFNAGFALSSRGQVAESLPYYAEAAELDPSSFDTLMALGVLNDKIGRVDEARRWFARAAAVDCASPQHAAAGNKCAHTKLRALRTIVPFFQRHGPPDAMGELRARFESAMAEAMGS
jgi:tetratricopeptide (TPR) repeat protein